MHSDARQTKIAKTAGAVSGFGETPAVNPPTCLRSVLSSM